MKTQFKQNISVVAGETDTVLKDGALNDSADAVNGMTVISGTFFMADGTNGMLIFVRITNAGGGVINQIEVRATANGVTKTIHTFAGLALAAAGLYVFQIQPSTTPSGFDGVIQGAAPNQGDLKLLLNNKDDAISASVSIQSTW